jgi:hypothetical protein
MGFPRTMPSSRSHAWSGPRPPLVLALALLTSLATTGCDRGPRDGPTAPSPDPGSLSGTWTGTIRESTTGTHRVAILIQERSVSGLGRVLSGTWRVDSDDPERNNSGTLTGSVMGGQAAVDLIPASRPDCPAPPSPFESWPAGNWSFLFTISPAGLTGSSLFFTCSRALPGGVELSR